MFSSISVTGIGGLIVVLEALLKMFGVEIADGSVAAGINGLVSFIGLVFMVWGQFRRSDLKFGLIRK